MSYRRRIATATPGLAGGLDRRRVRRLISVWAVVFMFGFAVFAPGRADAVSSSDAVGTAIGSGAIAAADCSLVEDLRERLSCEAQQAPIVGPVVGGTANAVSFAQDPFAWMATKTNEAVTSTMRALVTGMDATGAVPLGNRSFLEAFAKSWGVATFLTMILWLWAVGMRVVNRVPPGQAFSEALGYLVVAVLATSVVVPLVGVALTLVDELCKAVFSGFEEDMNHLLEMVNTSGATLASPANNPILALILGLILLIALLFVWLELVVRSAMVLIGLLFAPLVFAGLVNRNLWSASRKWVGVMAAVIMSKYIVYAVLTLGSALLASPTPNDFSSGLQTEISAIVLFVVAVWSSTSVARWVPIAGDSLHHGLSQRQHLTSPVRSSAGNVSTVALAGAGHLNSAIATHGYTGPDGSGVVPVAAAAGASDPSGAVRPMSEPRSPKVAPESGNGFGLGNGSQTGPTEADQVSESGPVLVKSAPSPAPADVPAQPTPLRPSTPQPTTSTEPNLPPPTPPAPEDGGGH